MKRTNIVIEVINSGLIPLLVGALIVVTASDFVWVLIGLGSVLVGLFLGSDYIEKTSQDTSEKRTEQ